MNVSLVVFDKKTFEVSAELLGEVESYIDEHYVEEHYDTRRISHLPANYKQTVFEDYEVSAIVSRLAPSAAMPKSLKDIVGKLDEPFATTLLRLIDKSGKSDTEVYKAANIDRRLFSKIRSNKNYAPSKPTILAFAVALQLNLDQTEDLLSRAGFAMSHSRLFDVIVEYFIASGKYDIYEINEVLFEHDQALLGG